MGTLLRLRYVWLASPLFGDFNADGVVDAADYTTWRDLLGEFVDLPNDRSAGLVSLSDYGDWVAKYGVSAASLALASVPEPNAVTLLALVSVASRFLAR